MSNASDIVSRIWACCLGKNDKISTLAKEAADEIERLRSEIYALEKECLKLPNSNSPKDSVG